LVWLTLEKGAISAKQLGAGFLLLAGCLFVIICRYSRGRRREEQDLNVSPGTDAPKMAGALRKIRIAISIAPALVTGLWLTLLGRKVSAFQAGDIRLALLVVLS